MAVPKAQPQKAKGVERPEGRDWPAACRLPQRQIIALDVPPGE